MPDDLINLTIDGVPLSVPKGMLVIEAAKQAGVLVPHYCYQPGECELQHFTCQEGRPGTRYSPEYPKRFNPVEDFGPDVLYVPNRCILCTRCVRFMEDIAQEPVLNVSERGDRAYIGVHPEARLDHPWAGNVVDLCPVGSLLSKDFLHKARAWELDKTASI